MLSEVAHGEGGPSCGEFFGSIAGPCAAFLHAHGSGLLHYPGLVASSIDSCFDAGFEVWFSGVAESGRAYSGSFSGNVLVMSWQGGRLLEGRCTPFAVTGPELVLRPYPKPAAAEASL